MTKFRSVLIILTTIVVLNVPSIIGQHKYSWVCREAKCIKVDKALGVEPGETPLPLGVCKLNCAAGGALWPLPTGKVEIGSGFVNFYPQNIEFAPFQAEDPQIQDLLQNGSDIFRSYLPKMHPDYSSEGGWEFPVDSSNPAVGNKLVINLAVVWKNRVIKIGNDESYTLAFVTSEDKKTVSVTILANTYFGARHGLETLSQLIAFNEDTGTLTIVEQATINDNPFFTYRGILMDTARNFISIPKLKRLIDGLSYNKMNMFHWHITDTHSFPFFSKSRPQMTQYGAYSPRKIYSIEQMQELVEYGRIRGVKVMPEFDAPAHVGNGWEWGPSQGLGNLAVCVNKEPWGDYCVEPPCGQLNPINDNVYDVLGDLYKDYLDIFENDLFHMGGDEVHLNCWNTTPEITQWMLDNGKGLAKEDFIELWSIFQDRAYEKVKAANNGEHIDAILWTSELVSKEHITQYLSNSTYIVQIWTNGHEEAEVIPYLIQNGYRTIFSNVDAWYLDCGYGAWIGNGENNWCSPYKGWQQVYSNSPLGILANKTNEETANDAYAKGLVLGGEAALWSEQVDEQSMEGKLWPRGAALGERLWTNPSTGWFDAELRLINHRQRLVERGLEPDRIQPEWCHQNERLCY